MTIIYHIAHEPDWRTAQGLGFYKGGDAFDKEGFIHFSSAEEIKASTELYYKGMEDLLLIAVFDYKLGTALKWESTRGGKLFPHLYAYLDPSDVEWVKPLCLGKDGLHIFPNLE